MPSLKSAILTSQFGQECPTLRRLRTIRPGDRVRYYLGNLPDDLQRSRTHLETAKYAAILQNIADTVRNLANEGRVRTHTIRHQRMLADGSTFQETQYYAEGV